MSTISRFCSRCRKQVQLEGDKCSVCGLRLRYEEEENDFLSGPFVPPDTIVTLHPGETLMDRFKIKSHLGSGRFGSVYLTEDTLGSAEVALKVVEVGPLTDDLPALQLKRERSLPSKISDFSHIIRVHDLHLMSWGGTGLLLLPMEYANGGSFRKWLLEHREDFEARRTIGLDYFKQACLGVQTIHEVGLVHLDLKPENLLLAGGKVKVSDLGLSRNYIQYAQNQETILKEFATPSYMSPEQFKSARQKDINPLSDIYTLGIILFEILDGHVPFDGKDFDELKKKHLTYRPPPLDNTLAPWSRIVNRCLAKEPVKRYESVDELLADLKRAERGDILLVDVSCKCGYINDNKDLKKCQECGADISHLFRRCPDCQRFNRLDVEVCPDCGLKIGRHFRIEGLLKKVHEMRDMDPVEAIRCLVEVLKLEGGNREVKEMLPGLREIQEKIEIIIPDAGKAQKEGRLEDAKGKWQDILSLAPRHLLATEKKKGLDQLIERYNTNYDRAFVLMDQGKFANARELLSECRDLIPTRKETDGALKDLNKREKPYSQHFEKAKSETRVKNLGSARKEADLCLVEAPISEEGLRLKTKIDKDMGEAARLFSDAKNLLTAAEFDAGQRDIEQIQGLQQDLSGFKGFIAEKEEIEKRYFQLFSKWEKSLTPEIRDLNEAEANLKKSLKFCPECREATKLLDQVVGDKIRAKQLIENAKSSIRTAEFDKAKDEITEAESIWRKVPHLFQTSEKLETSQEKYNSHVDTASKIYEERKDLNAALEEVEAALRICPESSNAEKLKNKIANDQKKAIDLLGKANSLIPKADFGNASKHIEKAGTLWLNVMGLEQVRDDLKKRKKTYADSFRRAADLYKKKDLDFAMKSAETALYICRQSDAAKDLLNKIQNDKEKAIKLIKGAQSLILSADFDIARSRLRNASGMWPSAPKLSNIKKELETKEEKYNFCYCKAKELFDRGKKLDVALDNAGFALGVCPYSSEASGIVKSISDRTRKRKDEIKRRRFFLIKALVVITVAIGLTIAFLQIETGNFPKGTSKSKYVSRSKPSLVEEAPKIKKTTSPEDGSIKKFIKKLKYFFRTYDIITSDTSSVTVYTGYVVKYDKYKSTKKTAFYILKEFNGNTRYICTTPNTHGLRYLNPGNHIKVWLNKAGFAIKTEKLS